MSPIVGTVCETFAQSFDHESTTPVSASTVHEDSDTPVLYSIPDACPCAPSPAIEWSQLVLYLGTASNIVVPYASYLVSRQVRILDQSMKPP